MKKGFLLVLAVATLIAIPVVVFANSGEGEVDLHQIRGSHITGEIVLEDNGADTLTITGEAEGLTPGGIYVSLIYDADSVSRGAFACEPIIPPGEDGDIEDTMVIGFWDVDEDGEGTLGPIVNILPTAVIFPPFPELDPVYVPLNLIGTVSIRDVIALGSLVACGDVEVDD